MPHNTAEPITLTGDILIDAMLLGSRWTGSVVTYAFPQTATAYNDGLPGYPSNWHLQNFQPFSPAWATHAETLLEEVASFTNLTFVEGDAETSSLRWGRFDDPGNGAYAYGPGSNAESGDQWFANNQNADPVVGDGVSHILRHELGHALGLSHPHEGLWGPMPSQYDSLEYSTMSYRQHTSQQPGDYSGIHNEQSFMMLDIAALQHMYGANFTFNATDTTYVFDPLTGRMIVNGAGGPVPAHDVVLRTIWDGGGVDTYDFSNFDGDQVVSLQPGAWSTFDESMLAVMIQRAQVPGGPLLPVHAAGNLANTLLYQDDARSLIENATTGDGDDRVTGNAADNLLVANAGDDMLWGMEGDDTLNGGLGNDLIDGGAGQDVLIVSGVASDYRLLLDGDDFILKGLDGGDHLTGIEVIRFSDGRVLELNRMYGSDFGGGGDIPEHLLSGDAGVGPLILPSVDGSKVDAEPLVLPGWEDGAPPLFPDLVAWTGDWRAPLDEHGGLTGEPASRVDPDWM